MASSSLAGRDSHMVGTLNRRPAMRITTRDYRPTLRRDAVLLGTTSFCGDGVYDVAGKFVGEIQELVLDLQSGRIAYALLVAAGFLGMGRKWFAVPWSTVTLDREYRRCVINIGIERLIDAPSLDGDILPRMADPGWAKEVHSYFGCKPYWE